MTQTRVQRPWYRKRLFVILGIVIILAVTVVIWGRVYLGWFTTSPLLQGQPVIVDPTPQPVKSTTVPYKIEPVANGLFVPWSVVFPSVDRWLVSERDGKVRVIQNGDLQPQPLITFDVSTTGEEGLMGLALDPEYTTNKLVYACYAAAKADGGMTDRVVRFTDDGQTAGAPQLLIDNIPAAQYHAGCRLSFGPADKKLYISTGDATQRSKAQDRSFLGGKILRINPDGSIPDDNPFDGSPVWTVGHRNPQGLAWQPSTGDLYATEHGPSGNDGPAGGDEINRIAKGQSYGWPIVSHERTDGRFVTPLLVFTPAVAPSGAVFYSSDKLPQFTGDLFFGGLRGLGLYRVEFSADDPTKVTMYQKMTDIDVGRVRDVTQGPDGSIYFTTSNRDGRASPREGDDRIYRIAPE